MPSRRIARYVPPGDRRSPLDRLTAMVAEQSPERRRRIMRAIREGLDDAPDPAPWIAAACTLRDGGTITADAAIYFTEIFLECIVGEAAATDPELLDIYDRIDLIEQAHGLGEDDFWKVGEGPPEWTALQEQWDVRASAVSAEYLRANGHEDFATLLVNDPEWQLHATMGYRDVFGDTIDPSLN